MSGMSERPKNYLNGLAMRDILDVYLFIGLWISTSFCDQLEDRPTRWHIILGVFIWPILLLLWATHITHPEGR
jgi:hypothetical protein